MIEVPSFLDAINEIPGVRAAWVGKIPGIEVAVDRDEAMRRLRSSHEAAVNAFAGADAGWWRAEQVHGAEVAVVPGAPQIIAPDGLPVVPAVDGLITVAPRQALAIYVADCGAIWLADRATGAIGLLHSGKKGTEGNILGVALEKMHEAFGTLPQDVVAALGPCIRPPDYEVDFAATIAEQAKQAGIGMFVDCGVNTAEDLACHYSYRTEKGFTGRMMALIVRES